MKLAVDDVDKRENKALLHVFGTTFGRCRPTGPLYTVPYGMLYARYAWGNGILGVRLHLLHPKVLTAKDRRRSWVLNLWP